MKQTNHPNGTQLPPGLYKYARRQYILQDSGWSLWHVDRIMRMTSFISNTQSDSSPQGLLRTKWRLKPCFITISSLVSLCPDCLFQDTIQLHWDELILEYFHAYLLPQNKRTRISYTETSVGSREEAVRGSQFVMLVNARLLQLLTGVFGRIRWVGMRLESFLAKETRASGLPIPLPTARALVGVDGVSVVTHTTTCGGTMIK